MVRFKIYAAGYQASVTALRDALGENDFDAAWAEGAALVAAVSEPQGPTRVVMVAAGLLSSAASVQRTSAPNSGHI